ncbi:hypothetical protein NGM10_15925 (plasmid) [Halorussus salilacus]|uniref:hypothetical protein n=1 Tax=Halorussus salilacus TaxID=2953750 RepID=UPI00209F8057|nr:hypothetical protein [Halorussus salilacus]USZ69892.1 hypothetical protein NGM10_15925 [Halorussus salilacus]
MATEDTSPARESNLPSPVYLVAAHLAVIVAVVHLTMGLYNWFRWASAGFFLPRDLRWPLFTVSGLAMVVGMFLAAQGRYRRPIYAGGVGLMAVYVLGYFGWHTSGHRPRLFFGRGSSHEGPLGQFLLDHLFAGPVEFVSLTSEVLLAVILVYLLIRDSG